MELLIPIMRLTASTLFFSIVVAGIIAGRTVDGTVLRYRSVTVIMTLFWPSVVLSAFSAASYSIDRSLFSAFLAVAQIIFSWVEWNRHKDEDNWWKGRGKKMGRAIKGLFEGPASSSLAGGAA